jgi:hypothetical protein
VALNVDRLEGEVLKLSPVLRARLAERLIHSLESLSDEERETLWIEEAQRRDREMDAGVAVSRSAEDVFRDARAELS